MARKVGRPGSRIGWIAVGAVGFFGGFAVFVSAVHALTGSLDLRLTPPDPAALATPSARSFASPSAEPAAPATTIDPASSTALRAATLLASPAPPLAHRAPPLAHAAPRLAPATAMHQAASSRCPPAAPVHRRRKLPHVRERTKMLRSAPPALLIPFTSSALAPAGSLDPRFGRHATLLINPRTVAATPAPAPPPPR